MRGQIKLKAGDMGCVNLIAYIYLLYHQGWRDLLVRSTCLLKRHLGLVIGAVAAEVVAVVAAAVVIVVVIAAVVKKV